MKASAVAFATIVVTALLACWHLDQVPFDELEAFVGTFLESVRDDTPFHRQYLEREREFEDAKAMRSHLQDGWRVTHWDGPLLLDEVYFETADGSHGTLQLVQKDREVTAVGLWFDPK